LAEACMRTRAVLFCNSAPGDAGSTAQSSASSNLIGVSVGAGFKAASTIEGFAKVATSSALGAVTLGLSSVFQTILGVFQHHAAAEKAQSNALSTITPQLTEIIRKADYGVAVKQLSPEDAINFLQQNFQQAKNAWAPIEHSCNAFCWYNDILDMIVSASQHYYQLALSTAALQQSDETNIIPQPHDSLLGTVQTSNAPIATIGGVQISSKTAIIAAIVGVALLVLTMSRPQVVQVRN